jgi:hypothetical protein
VGDDIFRNVVAFDGTASISLHAGWKFTELKPSPAFGVHGAVTSRSVTYC